jgi:hypothetical protein
MKAVASSTLHLAISSFIILPSSFPFDCGSGELTLFQFFCYPVRCCENYVDIFPMVGRALASAAATS